VLYVTQTDQQHFLALLPELKTAHLSTIAEVKTPGGSFGLREGILFLANFDNLANQDALRWLLQDIWPLIRKGLPDVTLYLAGHRASPQLAEGHCNVTVLGKIADLGPCFHRRRVFLSPIRFGTGIITKNMIAMAHGLPVVTTSVGGEGLQLRDGVHALLADDAAALAEKTIRLYRDEALWTTIAGTGRDYIATTFSLGNLRAQISSILAAAADLTPQPFEPNRHWSYRAIEEKCFEVLREVPTRYRAMLIAIAYLEMAEKYRRAGDFVKAQEQFRHIFASIRGQLASTVFHNSVLSGLADCYRALGELEGADRCDEERRRLGRIAGDLHSAPGQQRKGSSRTAPPEISLIIPTFNRAAILRLCLSALSFQSLPLDRWEVIVVDDGSTDDTECLCRNLVVPYAPIRYFRQKNLGAGAARRLGAEMARGAFLLLMNDDTILGSRTLAEHLSVHRANPGEKWAVLGNFEPSPDCAHRALSFWVHHSSFLFPQQRLVPGHPYDQAFFISCNLSIRRDAVLQAGSFDAAFRVAEDTELGTRMVQRGFRVIYRPEAGAVHEHSRFTCDDLIRRARNYGMANWRILQKHPHLLGDGSGPFGRLANEDRDRIQQTVESKSEAVAASVTALKLLDDFEISHLLKKTETGQVPAEGIFSQLATIVPMVYWHFLFETFLQEWTASKGHQFATAKPRPQVLVR
jgi:GT2 family glycosyltransferase